MSAPIIPAEVILKAFARAATGAAERVHDLLDKDPLMQQTLDEEAALRRAFRRFALPMETGGATGALGLEEIGGATGGGSAKHYKRKD